MASKKVKTRKYYSGVEGADEIIDVLKQIGLAANDILDEAAEAGGKIALADAKRRAPVSVAGRLYGKYAHPPGNLRDNIELKKPKSAASGKLKRRASVTIGPNKDAFYGKFVELGTKKLKAKPFLRPAIDENKAAIAKAVNETIEKALRGVK